MPLDWARVRHRLNLTILGRQRRNKRISARAHVGELGGQRWQRTRGATEYTRGRFGIHKLAHIRRLLFIAHSLQLFGPLADNASSSKRGEMLRGKRLTGFDQPRTASQIRYSSKAFGEMLHFEAWHQ